MPQTALITGASSGFGDIFARILASKGYNVVLVARSEDKLKALASELQAQYRIQATVIASDLSLPNAAEAIFAQLQNEPIDVLINNAGFGNYGKFIDNDAQSEVQLLNLNITTLTHLTRLFLPQMTARKRGYILNVASVGSFMPGPYMATYNASKAYVLLFSEAIAEELKDTGVSVSALCPGLVLTGFQSRANMHDSKFVATKEPMSGQRVCEIGIEGMFAGKRVIVPDAQSKFQEFLARIVPRGILVKMVSNALERK